MIKITIKEVEILKDNFKRGLATFEELYMIKSTKSLTKSANRELEKFMLAFQNFKRIE